VRWLDVILIIDNYDSFTFNLVQYLWELGAIVEVFRNDRIDIAGIRARSPEALVLSPGPCTPSEAGVCVPAIRELSGTVPILGVCLGHQAIGQAFGGRVVRAKNVMHGKTSRIEHDGSGIFSGVSAPLEAGRYHSLVVERDSLPAELRVTASSQDDGEIMAIAHRDHPTVGVQFHPESVLTPEGKKLLANFLEGRRC
jgi:anthranilate synthase/aminodeoxychorismate synthase-like glutamine amidotransferase